MIGTQSVKAIKLSSLARTSLRHALSSQSSSASHRANSTTSTQQHLPSGEFFTSAPAPPAVDYSSAFFTSAPVPTSTQAPAASAGRYQTADHTENGRTGKGNSQGKQRHEWTFSTGRVAAVQVSSVPSIDAGSLYTRVDEDEDAFLSSSRTRRASSISARPRSSSCLSPQPSSALINASNTRAAFQNKLFQLLSVASTQRAFTTDVVQVAWHHPGQQKLLLSSRSYNTEVETSSSPTAEPVAPRNTPSQATIEELPSDEPTSSHQSDMSPKTTSKATPQSIPSPRRNRVRSSSLPANMDRQPTKTEVSQEAKAHRLAINEAAATGPAELVREVVQRYRDSNDFYMAAHNAALSALTKWHSYDEPLQDILDVFEEMLIHNLNPNKDSYGTVIEALAQRDHNVQLRANQLRSELFEANRNALTQQERSAPSPPSSHIARSLEAQLDSLSKDDSCTAAFQFYKALGEQRRKRLPQAAFHALLQLCIRHKRNKDAVAVLKAYLSNHVGHPDFEAIALAIRACATVKDLKSADQVFQRYLQLVGVRNTSDDNENVLHTEAELTVWHEMLGAAFNAGDSHKAISVFEQLASQKPSSGLKVDPRILERMLSGFSELGDGTSAIAWAQRVTTDPHFSTQIGLTPSFLTPSITLLASRISSFDFSAASDACFIYSVMRDFANTTNQPYSGAALQQLITTIIPHTFQAPRTNTVTQLWDRLAEFVQQFHEDAAKHASANLYLAPESVALLERARSSPAVQTPSEEIHPDTQSQGPRESLTSGPSEHASQNSTPSPYSVTSTDFTPPVDDIQKTSDSTLPIVRPLSPAASYVASSNYAPAQSLSQWDQEATSEVEQIFREVRHYDSGGPQAARIIIRAAQKHGFVHPELVSEALARCGRARDDSLVEQAYLAGYASLHLLELDPAAQLEGWYQLENAALIAAANAGHLDRASTHRSRLIEAGSAPSAEAYGTLILNAKDTTDDASVAIELFEESRRLGVAPNTFLFNNLISRLSKARRTKAVLECFEQMKAAGIATTSVTYGAVINACCKIGDVSAAAFLFEEMTSLVDFTPKVPPYNTMIQFFVSTKPDRERALYYYQRMLKANVKPSAHTYKLLLDCYGSLHPVDVRSMRDVFKTLEKDIPVEGTHWAALINSYGLSQNDLDTAIETFESIKQHPQSRKSGLPDAVTFEAMLNTCLANGRPDLVEHFSAEMRSSGLHSTAYCENARIKAFTRQGNLEGSRAVFDALADPPSGVAATGNHPGGRRHGKKRLADRPASGSPVYREPSSYDAMIRAEVQMGDPARASEIVDLARQRAFPAQVIKGLQDLLNTPVQ